MTDTSSRTYDDGRIVVEFDQHSPEYQAHSAELSHELRGKCPVTWSESHGGFWVVTGLDEVSAMYKHPELFSAFKDTENPESRVPGHPDTRPPACRSLPGSSRWTRRCSSTSGGYSTRTSRRRRSRSGSPWSAI